MQVVDDVVNSKGVLISFDDGSTVVVREIHSASPPYFQQVDGDFTNDQVAAITTWSHLPDRPQ